MTDKKPQFNDTCETIKFGKERDDKIKDSNIKFQKVINNKWWVYTYFIFFNLFALTLFYLDYLFLDFLKYFFLMAYTVPVIILAIAIVLLGMGWGALNNYRSNLSIARANKNKVDATLSLYQLEYDLKVKFRKSFHGEPVVDTQLKILPFKK